MKTLVHFELEGLLDERGYTIWVPLGRFGSRDAAVAASKRSHQRGSFSDTRIIPLFRDPTGGYARLDQPAESLTIRRPVAKDADADRSIVPTTVA